MNCSISNQLNFWTVVFALHAGLTVECGDEEMIIYLEYKHVHFIIKEATLLDDSCALDKERNSNMTHLWIKVPFSSCLTKTSTEGDMIIYQNSVVITRVTLAREVAILRDVIVEMPFRCSKRGKIVTCWQTSVLLNSAANVTGRPCFLLCSPEACGREGVVVDSAPIRTPKVFKLRQIICRTMLKF